MTALCPSGGTSSPKAGLAEVVAVTSGAIALALQRYGAARLQFLIPLLGLPPLELAPFCATDPPALPTFTSDEVYALLFVKLDTDYFSGLAKARDMVLRMLWYDLCDCDAGSPTTFVQPTLPTNTPDPVLPAPAIVTPCASFTHTGGSGFCSGTSSFWLGATPLPRNVTAWRITSTGAIQSGAGVTYKYQMQENGTGSFANTVVTDNFPPGVPHQFSGVVANPNSTYLQGIITYVSGADCSMAQDTLELFCNGDVPGASQSPCCPPDPATQSYLDLILQMVTLIQRQSAPFSYVYGANHAGLTGSGELDVFSLLGVSVDVTVNPGYTGLVVGDPDTIFDVGWVTLGTADGWTQSRAIDHDGMLMLPGQAGVFTKIGYTLNPGVEVSIRELVREP